MKNFERCIVADAPQGRFFKIMLVGSAPTQDEEAAGRPLVGPASDHLDSLLARAELLRSSCVLTNVFHVRPKNDELANFFTGVEEEADQVLKPYKYDGGMLRAEYGVEMQRFMGELKKWKPRVLVAMGACPLWAITGRTDIKECIGQALTVQNHIVLTMPSPRYLLANRNDFTDLAAVKTLADAKHFSGIE